MSVKRQINDIMGSSSPKKEVPRIDKIPSIQKTDFNNDNTAIEYFSNQLYRELLNNLYDLLEVRGTKLGEKNTEFTKCPVCNKKAQHTIYISKAY